MSCSEGRRRAKSFGGKHTEKTSHKDRKGDFFPKDMTFQKGYVDSDCQDIYQAVDALVAQVKEHFADQPKVGKIFERFMTTTLQTTAKIGPDGSVFVITGDIPAMWLRDSVCQFRPFVGVARQEPGIRAILEGLIQKRVDCILTDPYANAFNESANGKGFQQDKTDRKPELWERKYEIDSLCYPIQLSYLFWKNAGVTAHFTQKWLQAAKKVVEVFRTEQYHEEKSPYTFERTDCVFTDTLSRQGKGALVKSGIGLIWSGFRPSDDACVYGYLIPSNMLACVVLGYLSEIAQTVMFGIRPSRCRRSPRRTLPSGNGCCKCLYRQMPALK